MFRTRNIKILRIAVMIVVAVIVIGYAIMRSLNYARGPEIIVRYPENGSATTSQSVELSGQAVRISDISLNGRPISVDEAGNFRETVVIFDGVNIWTIQAHDQFGREISRQMQIVKI